MSNARKPSLAKPVEPLPTQQSEAEPVITQAAPKQPAVPAAEPPIKYFVSRRVWPD